MRRVFIDCPEHIPCNPCQYACPAGAITIGENITGRPVAATAKCTGCGLCVAACPGQACFLVDPDYSGVEATVDFPYEFLPLPEPGMEVEARNNDGEAVCTGRILQIRPGNGGTRIVRIAIPRQYAYDVRGMKPLER